MILHRMTLAYDGTDYLGWQLQPQGATIQSRLQEALANIAGDPVTVVGAGRTDAGVHAQGQVAHFELPTPVPPSGLLKGLNSMLPQDIRILDVELAPPDFHARYTARSKTYRYCFDVSPVASPFRCRYTLHHPYPLDWEAMSKAAERFVGRHDFESFRASSCEAKTSERHCTVSRFVREGAELVYEVAADGFLHHMVRNIVGTLLEVGRGKIDPGEIDRLLEAKDRKQAGPTAPAQGLHLMRVEY
ncbi:MAG TPA: tRNA pseudouridine(38-40) synthase TruA [Vicinamibacteria bacterium]|jgi:tRNA pseudouridine38-40 synthase